MATPSKASSWNFYLMGREEKRLIKHEIDVNAAAKRFVAENSPLDGSWMGWLTTACQEAAKSISTRSRNEWLRENSEVIAAAGMEDVAYDLYVAGRVAELRYALEEAFIEAIANAVDEAAEGQSVH